MEYGDIRRETDGVEKPSAHMIVLGNEKGGSGKSTTAMHIIVTLLKAGHRVASVDTDSRQQSLTRYVENRQRWAQKAGLALELPEHFAVPLADGNVVREAQKREYDAFVEVVERVRNGFDFIVVDTPGTNSYLMRLSHGMADTLVTPINDSFIDLDILGRVDPETYVATEVSHYGALIGAARRERDEQGGPPLDWVVVRNRLSTLYNRNQRAMVSALTGLSEAVGFRIAAGISERVIFRELFPIGLTALDRLDRTTLGGSEPTMSHVAARREIRELVDTLRLPIAPLEARAA